MIVKFWVSNTELQTNFTVVFSTEDQALAYFERKHTTHILTENEDAPMPDSWTRMNDKLYPTCEHGLSAWLCAGPEHYPTDQQLMTGAY